MEAIGEIVLKFQPKALIVSIDYYSLFGLGNSNFGMQRTLPCGHRRTSDKISPFDWTNLVIALRNIRKEHTQAGFSFRRHT
jgi:hypothetical protein